MSTRVKLLLKAGKKNKEFNAAILSADGDKPPGFFASTVDEGIYTTVYYGWLVCKYGDSWEDHLSNL